MHVIANHFASALHEADIFLYLAAAETFDETASGDDVGESAADVLTVPTPEQTDTVASMRLSGKDCTTNECVLLRISTA